MRHTKIVATVGPASHTPDVLAALVEAGVDVFRLNFSHGTHESHREVYERIRTAASAAGRIVAIMQDLSGPKIRTTAVEGGGALDLAAGSELRIRAGEDPGRPGLVFTPYAELYHHESATRGRETTPDKAARFDREIAQMKSRWGDALLRDPYYSPHLTLDFEDFSIGVRA